MVDAGQNAAAELHNRKKIWGAFLLLVWLLQESSESLNSPETIRYPFYS